jgi:hypothetical protein
MGQPAQTGIALGHQCGERLIDLMGYCGGKFSDRRHASDVREVPPSFPYARCREPARADATP